MPTSYYSLYDTFPYGMRMETASKVIREVYPKWWLFQKRKNYTVSYVIRALNYAKVKCNSESLKDCIEWAYNVW